MVWFTGKDGKECTKCKTFKKYDQFSKDRHSSDLYCYHCKACKKKYKDEWDSRQEVKKEFNKGVTLVIPDIQAPFHHQDTIDFLDAIKNKYQPNKIVCIGDEIDLACISQFDKEVDLPTPDEELEDAQVFWQKMFKLFPEAVALESNHVHGRLAKLRKSGSIPQFMLKPFNEIIGAPKGWEWKEEHLDGDVLYLHGHTIPKNLKKVIMELMPKEKGKHVSIVAGHHHTEFGQFTPDIKVGDQIFWGAFTGALIDRHAPAFRYTKRRPTLGTMCVIDGRPHPILMKTDQHERWIGDL